MKKLFFREANRFAREPLQACAQGQVLTFQPLQQGLGLGALRCGQAVHIRPPGIGEPVADPPAGLGQHATQAPERGVGAPPKHKGQHPARGCVLDPPEPARRFFSP